MTDEIHIAKLFAAAFTELDGLRQRSPAAAAAIGKSIASHLRSSAPLALLTPPPSSTVPSVERELADGSRYVLASESGCTVLKLRDDEEMIGFVATLTPVEAIRFIDDVKAVNGG